MENDISSQSAQWVEEHREDILRWFVHDKHPRYSQKCILMSGSPGSGKTETVRRLKLAETFVVLEADAIREKIPYYVKTDGDRKGNAHLLQKASGKGLDYCRKYCIDEGIAFVQDTTFSNKGGIDLVKKLDKRGWIVSIIFILQNPKKSLKFTEIREKREGRSIPKESLVSGFIGSIENISLVQKNFPGVRIFLHAKNNGEEVVEKEVLDTPIFDILNPFLKGWGIDSLDESSILKVL